MTDIPDTTTPIKDYIQSALFQIKEALPDDARVDGIINIEMSTVVQKGRGGKVDISVINYGSDASEHQTQKIMIPIRLLTDAGKAVEDALKAKAESDKAGATFERRMAEVKTAALGNKGLSSSHGVKSADSTTSLIPKM